jgi:TolB protein
MKAMRTLFHKQLFSFAVVFVAVGSTAEAASGVADQVVDRILFVSNATVAKGGGVGLIHSDGKGERYLKLDVPDQETWHLGPMFSDGRRIILTSLEKQPTYGPDKPFGDYYIKTPSRMWIYDLEADRLEKEIMTEDRLAPLCFPQMLVPGEERMIVQVLTRHSNIGKIFNMNLDGSDAQPFTRKGEGFPYVFDASPDGRRTTFHVGGPDPHGYRIFTRDMDGGNPILVAGELDRFYFGPSYSPDGEWIVYAGRDRGDHGEASDWADVCIGRPDGSEQRVLTSGCPFWFSPSYGNPQIKGGGSSLLKWTPDGAIVYPRKIPGSVNPWEFGDPREDVDHFNREWDASRARGGTFISRLDPRTGEEVALTPEVEGQWDLRAVPSPDGSQVAFLRAQVGQMPSLWVMNADGSNPRKLTDGFGEFGADHPQWVPAKP